MGGTTTLALGGASLLKSQMSSKGKADNGAASGYQMRVDELARQQSVDAKERQDALAKASATQRAKFASGGVSPADGSSGAVLNGLQAKTTQELDNQASAYGAKVASVQNSFSQNQASFLSPGKESGKTSADYLFGDSGSLQKLKDWD